MKFLNPIITEAFSWGEKNKNIDAYIKVNHKDGSISILTVLKGNFIRKKSPIYLMDQVAPVGHYIDSQEGILIFPFRIHPRLFSSFTLYVRTLREDIVLSGCKPQGTEFTNVHSYSWATVERTPREECKILL